MYKLVELIQHWPIRQKLKVWALDISDIFPIFCRYISEISTIFFIKGWFLLCRRYIDDIFSSVDISYLYIVFIFSKTQYIIDISQYFHSWLSFIKVIFGSLGKTKKWDNIFYLILIGIKHNFSCFKAITFEL